MATDFGRDISCTTSLRTGRYSTGIRLLGEAAFRRITTPRGMLRGGEEERNYGIDVTALVGGSNPKLALAKLPGLIQSELLKDERFLNVTADVVAVTEGPSTSFVITIAFETQDGPFNLKVGVDEVSAQLLGIEAQS